MSSTIVAELLINGPKGVARATVEVQSDGSIHCAFAEAALAAALNLYNELPSPTAKPALTSRDKTL